VGRVEVLDDLLVAGAVTAGETGPDGQAHRARPRIAVSAAAGAE
jgi:hypothetical protein